LDRSNEAGITLCVHEPLCVPSPLVGEGQGGGIRQRLPPGFPPPLTPPRKGEGDRLAQVGNAISNTMAADGDTVFAKHDETYMPPEVAKALKEQGVWQGDAKAKGGVPK
jgi:hypothetical protein